MSLWQRRTMTPKRQAANADSARSFQRILGKMLGEGAEQVGFEVRHLQNKSETRSSLSGHNLVWLTTQAGMSLRINWLILCAALYIAELAKGRASGARPVWGSGRQAPSQREPTGPQNGFLTEQSEGVVENKGSASKTNRKQS